MSPHGPTSSDGFVSTNNTVAKMTELFLKPFSRGPPTRRTYGHTNEAYVRSHQRGVRTDTRTRRTYGHTNEAYVRTHQRGVRTDTRTDITDDGQTIDSKMAKFNELHFAQDDKERHLRQPVRREQLIVSHATHRESRDSP